MNNKHNINLILNDISLKRFNTVPTFKNLLFPNQLSQLKIGDNKLVVNNTVWSKLQQLEGPGSYEVIKLNEQIQERNLTPQEIATQEKILKDLKQNKSQFVKRYGPDSEKIMFGIATKRAKQQSENMNKEKIREAVREALGASKIKEEGKPLDPRFVSFDVDEDFLNSFETKFQASNFNQSVGKGEYVYQNKISKDGDKIIVQFFRKPRKQ